MAVWPGAVKTWTAVLVTVADLNTEIRDRFSWAKTSIDDNGHVIDPVIQTKTATYTIVGTDDLIVCTSGTFVLTLPTAVGRSGKCFKVKNTGTGTITMGSTSAQTIDGSTASGTILLQNDALTFESNNANWLIV